MLRSAPLFRFFNAAVRHAPGRPRPEVEVTRPARFLLFLFLTASAVSAQPSRESVPAIALQGGTLIDVHTGQQIANSLIVVEGDRIKQVGRESDIVVPREARVIDAQGKWIIPGLMDLHAHISVAKNLPLELYLVNGVTTIRDPGGNLTLLRLARQEIDAGKKTGAQSSFFPVMCLTAIHRFGPTSASWPTRTNAPKAPSIS